MAGTSQIGASNGKNMDKLSVNHGFSAPFNHLDEGRKMSKGQKFQTPRTSRCFSLGNAGNSAILHGKLLGKNRWTRHLPTFPTQSHSLCGKMCGKIPTRVGTIYTNKRHGPFQVFSPIKPPLGVSHFRSRMKTLVRTMSNADLRTPS